MTTLTEPLPWEADPDSAVFDGLELPDGRLLAFEPHPDCPCADCRAAERAGYFDPEAAA